LSVLGSTPYTNGINIHCFEENNGLSAEMIRNRGIGRFIKKTS
jgi:hypothetical protein